MFPSMAYSHGHLRFSTNAFRPRPVWISDCYSPGLFGALLSLNTIMENKVK